MVKDTAYYDLLAVSPSATPGEIRKAYRLKALQCHPDRAGNSTEAKEAFQHLKAVYEILSDADRRAVYDEEGPSSNLHGDDDDVLDAEGLAAFFRTHTNPVTAEDIAAYERRYRNGEDEREDLRAHYERFDGDVAKVLDYIPYSNETDVERFIAAWEADIQDGQLERTAAWKRAKKELVRMAKNVTPRNVDEDAEDIEQEEGEDDGEQTEGKKKASKKKERKKNKKEKEDEDMAALVASIQAKRQRGQQAFDNWAKKYEAMSREEDERKAAGRKGGRRKSQGEPSELKAEGGVKKKGKVRGKK